MDEIGLFFSSKGRIDGKTFGWCVLAVYVLGFFSQALLSGNVIARAGLWPFIVVHGALIWAWIALHIKRLRDANEGPAGAIGVAVVYSLAIGLLVLVISLFTGFPAHGDKPPGTPLSAGEAIVALFVIIVIFNLLFSGDFSLFATLITVLVAIACLPLLISILFSLRTGLRQSVVPAPGTPPPALPSAGAPPASATSAAPDSAARPPPPDAASPPPA
jgi:uncharacterized membrane protein YhaH (DUF805 family)